MADELRKRPRGPRRAPGSPNGPDEVRRALLEAAATLFALRGIDAVSLRDIAAEADVHLALIRRYVGTREQLVVAVLDYLSDQVARAVLDSPLSGQGFEPDTVMGRWVRVVAARVVAGRPVGPSAQFNPVRAMATTLEEGYGLDPRSARLRAAQIVAAALGWRIFEAYLISAGGLEDFPLATLREELARSARRLGATPWPSPPDPEPRPR